MAQDPMKELRRGAVEDRSVSSIVRAVLKADPGAKART